MAASSSSASSSSSSSSLALPASLEQARIQTLPSTAYYIPNFISESEERIILDKIRSAPQPKWKQLTHRRLQTWPSDLVQDRLLDAPLPDWLETPIVPRLVSLSRSEDHDGHIFAESPHSRPNHDGGAYWPVVCTVSLGASLCLNLHQSREDGALDPQPVARILQEPRSLLITTDSLYTDYLHGISDAVEDVGLCAETIANWSLLRGAESFVGGRNMRQTRTSLTYRDVLKVSNVGNKLGLFRKR
ncbi:Alpha-ketoglutarate-dependent dioxygenase alkB -like protein 6 [Escovopsis weberi]|uniref:Alpha-ketoglutarate-dependent dioxygenase alkB-like protein 6 n=1 Tax=Escovopsis weberi TaxID=150374 RepID=A0A0M8N116_ESCWE|nr:Alpha-ketoglutarate-dependent dioxygenase alkB -like protein 6 [Escovopsis weberi]